MVNKKAPTPLLAQGQPVDWWFIFKFNAGSFPGCGDGSKREGLFGGQVKDYKYFSQQYVYASSEEPALQKGTGCVGTSLTDPLGATFDQIYNNSYYYLIWNDQFYGDPPIHGCEKACSAPWGHSKGMLAWNEDGEGFVMQVSTPSWPASGSNKYPRKTDGNTLGCVKDDNIEVSQHFFALKLNQDDLISVLKAVKNSSVVTDPTNPQIVRNGGPKAVHELVKSLGEESSSTTCTKTRLSSGVELISKPSDLHVPPWQLVSATLAGVPLRVASWWAHPKVYSTTASTDIGCWQKDLNTPGPVQIATSGNWDGKSIGLTGGEGPHHNHAKLGVSADSTIPYSIFGDMNQQGALHKGYAYDTQKCDSSQNGRGGLFYVLDNPDLFNSITKLLEGASAPTSAPPKT
jgi:hypothetical protein